MLSIMSPEPAQATVYAPSTTADRARARAQVAARGLTAVAAERVVRIALGQLPVTLVGRATAHLRRFFSDGSWSSDDDAALAAAVGPGKNWYEDHLDTDLALEFGWRGGAFKVEVRYTADDSSAEFDDEHPSDAGVYGRTLGDTFEDAIVLDAGRTPNEIRFGIGPVPGTANFTRDSNDRDPRVAVLFRECPDLEQVSIGAGMLSATIADASRWSDILLTLIDAIIAGFVQSRPAPPDRQLERAQREIGSLSPDSSRDLARILDASTSPDAAFRRVAIERLVGTDAVVGRAPWRRGLADSSRAVRRTAARVIALTADPETRDLLEQALTDNDACVRYYGVSGLARIGVSTGLPALVALRTDPDVRVRLAAEAVAEGRMPG